MHFGGENYQASNLVQQPGFWHWTCTQCRRDAEADTLLEHRIGVFPFLNLHPLPSGRRSGVSVMDSERATMQRRRSSNTSGLMDGSGSSTRVRRGNSNDNNIPGPSFSSLDAGRGSSKGLTKSNLQRRSSLGVLQEEDTRRYAQDDNEDEELLSSSADELYASYEREGHAPSTAAPPHPDDTFSGPLHYVSS